MADIKSYIQKKLDDFSQGVASKLVQSSPVSVKNNYVQFSPQASNTIRSVGNAYNQFSSGIKQIPFIGGGMYKPVEDAVKSTVQFASDPQAIANRRGVRQYADTVGKGVNAYLSIAGGRGILKQGAKSAAAYLGTSALIGGGLGKATGGSFTEGAVSGLNVAPKLSGIGQFTNPVISRAATSAGLRFTNPIAQQVTNRVATGLGNIPEGYVMGQAMGRQNYTPYDAALDFGIGAVTGSNRSGVRVKGAVGRPGGMEGDSMDLIQQANEILKNKRKYTPEQIKDAKGIIYNAAEKFLSPKERPESADPNAIVRAIFKRYKDVPSFDSGITLGVVDNKNKTIGQLQQATQIPELTQYENAMNSGNFKLADEISRKFPGDARFGVHKRFMPQESATPMVSSLVKPKIQVTKGGQVKAVAQQVANSQLKNIITYQDRLVKELGYPIKEAQKISAQDGERLLRDNILFGTKSSKVSGLKKIGAVPIDNKIQDVKDYVNKLYTQAIDRFHPISKLAKGAGKDQAMRNALSQNYGAGSTASYHVDFELSPILKSVDADDLREYTIAQRDIELAARSIKGSSTNEGQKVIARLQQKYGGDLSQIDNAANQLYEYQRNMVKTYLVDTGVISRENYEVMISRNQKYVPFKRIMDEMDDFLGAAPQQKNVGSVGSQNVIKGIKGSERQIVDPLQSIIENTFKMVALGKRNQVARQIAGLSQQYPQLIKPYSGEVGIKPVISVFENGKVQKYLVPQDVAEAAKGLEEETLNAVIKILSIPTQVLRTTATGYNPEFQAPNVFRDLQSAFVNAGANPLRFAQGMAHLIKRDEMYQEFLKAGGKTSSVILDRPNLIKRVGDITKTKGLTVTRPLELLRTMSEMSEQPTRIAVFEKTLKKMLKQGMSREDALKEAAYQAQEATVNFARRGSKTKAANALYAFLNARAQGADRLIRTIKNDPVGGTFRLALISQVPAVLLYAWNRQFPEYYDDRIVSEYDKKNNFIFLLPGEGPMGMKYIKVPKAEIGKFSNPTEAFLAYMDGKDTNAVEELIAAFTSLSPVSSMGDMIPTAIRPPIEAASNYSFFTNRDIVPEYKKNYPAPYQYTSQTPSIYRVIGQETNQSPAKLQALAEGYGTGYAKLGASAAEALLPDKYKGKADYTGAPINNTPVIRRFAGGEKRTEAEQQAIEQKRIESNKYRIQDIKGGIRRGDIPADEGLRQIQNIQSDSEKQIKLMGSGGVIKEQKKDKNLTPQEVKIQDEVFKTEFEISSDKVAVRNNKLYYKNPSGTPKVVDLSTGKPSSDPIQRAKDEASRDNRIRSTGTAVYFADHLNQEEKNKIYKALGTTPEQVEFRAIDSLPNIYKANVVGQILTERNWNNIKVNKFIDEGIMTKSLADSMVERGVISDQQGDVLKQYIKTYANGKLGKTGKSTRARKIKVSMPRVLKIKRSKMPKLKAPKPVKLKSYKQKKYKITKPKKIS